MDASATDRVLVIVDGRTAEVPRGTTILQAARQMGVTIPTLCNYRGLSPYGACRVCLVEIETPRGRQLVASCSHPIENNLVVHTETENVKESRRTVLELLLAQAPDSAGTGRVRRRTGRRVHPVSADGRRQVHPLRAVRPGLQRDDGPRGDQPLRPRHVAGSADGLRRADRSVPGVRGLRVRLSHGGSRSGHDHGAPDAAPHHGVRQVSERPAVHRPGPSAGLAARAGDRPRELHPFQDGRVRPVLQGLPGRRHRLRPAGGNRPTWRSAAWC